MRWMKWLGYFFGAFVVLACLRFGPRYAFIAYFENPTIATWRGHRDAHQDVSHGVYQEIVQGLVMMPRAGSYKEELKSRYNVNLAFTGCVVTDASLAYARAYNEVAVEGINDHFGHDVFKEVSEEVDAEQKQARPQPLVNATP